MMTSDRGLALRFSASGRTGEFLFSQKKCGLSGGRFLQPRAAEDDDRGSHTVLALNQLRLEQFESNANGPQFFTLKEF